MLGRITCSVEFYSFHFTISPSLLDVYRMGVMAKEWLQCPYRLPPPYIVTWHRSHLFLHSWHPACTVQRRQLAYKIGPLSLLSYSPGHLTVIANFKLAERELRRLLGRPLIMQSELTYFNNTLA